MAVAFVSIRNLERAENLKAVWDAYDGEKIFIQSGSRDFSIELATKKFDLVVTDDFIPECISPIIIIFHGAPGGKLYGLDMRGAYHTRESEKHYKCFISSSPWLIDFTARQCGTSTSKVLPLGMPRTDAYIGKKKGDGGTKYADKKVYLYAPTFGTLTQNLTQWNYIDELLNDDEVLLIKNHPYVKDVPIQDLFMMNHIERVPWYEPSTPYLIDCDIVITDYSSIMFDAYVLDKPVVLYEKDWQTYKERRGMSFPYPEFYSSRHTYQGAQMIKMCRDALKKPDPVCIENKTKIMGACDGHSTERIIELIKKEVRNGERQRSQIR